MHSPLKIIERAHTGNLEGMNFAGLVRLSFETNPKDKEKPRAIPLTGADINNREEQERKCRAYVESRGGNYIDTYDEPDTSAWKKQRIQQADGTYIYRVIRPVLEGALLDLKRGVARNGQRLDGMIAYDLDRLTRDNRHLEDAIEVVQYFERPIIDIRGSLDLLTDNGRAAARHMVTAHNTASAATSRRVEDKHYVLAINGIPVGGTRSFGWADDKRTLIPHEAQLIQQAARDLLAGVGATTICERWQAAGIRTTKDNIFRRRTFVQMMLSPRLVGWRVYGPKDKPLYERYICDAEGKPVIGQYPAILDIDTWHAVVAILAGPDRKGALHNDGKLKYPSSNLLRCGNCGKPMGGQPKRGGGHDYVCKPPTINGGCGKMAGAGKAIDALIKEYVFASLAEQQLIASDMPWPGAPELAELEASKTALLQQFNENPDMGAYIWPKIREAEGKIAELVKDRAAHNRKYAKPKQTDIRDRWDDLAVEQQRAVAAELIEVAILDAPKRHSNRFDPSRLRVIPRQ